MIGVYKTLPKLGFTQWNGVGRGHPTKWDPNPDSSVDHAFPSRLLVQESIKQMAPSALYMFV